MGVLSLCAEPRALALGYLDNIEKRHSSFDLPAINNWGAASAALVFVRLFFKRVMS